MYNHIEGNGPLVVIPPQFEKTVRTNMTAMLYLVNNGFNVFRYDNRYHNGNSTGSIEKYTMPNALQDLCDVMKFIRGDSAIKTDEGITVMGTSIASRIVFRYLSNKGEGIDVFVALVGVVNMRYTLNNILGFDLVGEYLNNSEACWGMHKVLKCAVDLDNFITSLVSTNMHSLESTQEDIDRIATPVYLIVAEHDRWIDINDYRKVFGNNREIMKKMYKLPGADHELYKNPQAAEHALCQIVNILRSHWNMPCDRPVLKPKIAKIIELNRREREREFKFRALDMT